MTVEIAIATATSTSTAQTAAVDGRTVDSHTPGSYVVERIANLDGAAFGARYRLPRRPVILTGVLRNWSACEHFTPEFFQRDYPDRVVRVRGRDRRLGEMLALQRASSADAPAPYPCTLSDCSDLLAQISPRFACSLPSRHAHPLLPKRIFEWVNHLEIFFGGPGGIFPYLHYDYLHMHAWIAQVHGDKEFTLYEPGQEALLQIDPAKPWLSTVDHSVEPDPERYPLWHKARRHKVVLHAGEALFLPCGTWHTARCLNMGITVAFDQLGADNWRDFITDACAAERRAGRSVRARVLGFYLRLLGPVLGLTEMLGANRCHDWGARRD